MENSQSWLIGTIKNKLFNIVKSLTPRPLLRFLKSVFFILKHFTLSKANKDFALPQEFNSTQNAVVFFGHSNYLNSTGGTERVILQEVEDLISSKLNSIFIYPKISIVGTHARKPKTYGIILNGYEVGEIRQNSLNSFFTKVSIKEVRVHHLLNWPLSQFLVILKQLAARKIKISIYAHDFYFHCPKVNSFCRGGIKRCNESYYQFIVKYWRKKYSDIFRIATSIKVPSEFLKNEMDRVYSEKIEIFSPYRLSMTIAPKRKLAYLGYASPIKGYDMWVQLANNALINRKYELIHVGQRVAPIKYIPSIEYSFHTDKSFVASKLLRDLNIDLVLLWSQVPESFSFTFHEATQANAFVITSSKSGNIAFEISKNPKLGISLPSNYQLVQYLLNEI